MIAGTVSSSQGTPISTARVDLETSEGDYIESTVTDGSGSFAFNDVRGGNYVIAINASGYFSGNWIIQVAGSSLVGLSYMLNPTSSAPGPLPRREEGPSTVSVGQLLVPKKAFKEFQKAVDSEGRGKTDDAIKHWQKSIEIYPKYAESYMRLSQVYANRGDTAEATQAGERAVELDSKNAAPYDFLGYAYSKAGEDPKAIAAFEKAVALSSTNWFGHFWLGRLLFQQHDAQGAYPHLLAASQIRPEVPEIHILFYNDLLVLGHPRDALAQLDYFIKNFPNDPMIGTVEKTREILLKSMTAATH